MGKWGLGFLYSCCQEGGVIPQTMIDVVAEAFEVVENFFT